MTTAAFDNHERSQWVGRASAYQDSVAALCAYPASFLLEAAQVDAGTRLLDVGTGTGTVAGLACVRGARVTAVDAEPSMLTVARQHVPRALVCQAILPDLPFSDDHFDCAVANFVLNHVGDPTATLTELRRVVRPGGRIAVTIWPYPPPTAQRLWRQILEAAAVTPLTDLPRLPPDKDFARTCDGLSQLLRRAGLDNMWCDAITWVHRTDTDAWWNGPANGIGAIGTLMQRQDPGTIERIREQYDQHIAPYRDAHGYLALPTAALLASASVP